MVQKKHRKNNSKMIELIYYIQQTNVATTYVHHFFNDMHLKHMFFCNKHQKDILYYKPKKDTYYSMYSEQNHAISTKAMKNV